MLDVIVLRVRVNNNLKNYIIDARDYNPCSFTDRMILFVEQSITFLRIILLFVQESCCGRAINSYKIIFIYLRLLLVVMLLKLRVVIIVIQNYCSSGK